MSIDRAKQRAEAVARMELWGIYPQTIRQFRNSNLISESTPPIGACFWLNNEQLERVWQFEIKYNAIVYHVIHSYTEFGELENYLYVSSHPEEWDMDRDDIQQGSQVAYVYNVDAPDFSEFGHIGVQLSPAAGLLRTW